jgi:hypothetical protein
MYSRRDFIKMMAMFGVLVLTPLNKILRKISFVPRNGDSSEGELYEGFVLLEQDAPVPFFVEGAPCPILCQEDKAEELDSEFARYRGKVSWFDSIESLLDNIDFNTFVPGSLPDKMAYLQGYVLSFAGSGEVWEARLDFGFEDNREPLISVSARPIFARPYPVWPVLTFPKKEADDVILDEEYVVNNPEKIKFTPEQGVMLPTERGYTLQWIKKDVLYTMFMEYDGWRDIPEKVGESLVEK